METSEISIKVEPEDLQYFQYQTIQPDEGHDQIKIKVEAPEVEIKQEPLDATEDVQTCPRFSVKVFECPDCHQVLGSLNRSVVCTVNCNSVLAVYSSPKILFTSIPF